MRWIDVFLLQFCRQVVYTVLNEDRFRSGLVVFHVQVFAVAEEALTLWQAN